MLLLMVAGHPCFARDRCAALKGLRLPKVEIRAAALVQAGSFASSAPTIAGSSLVALAAHCEVKAVARPTSDSEIEMEIWLPLRDWNGRYQQIGNGGWAGAIHHRPMVDAVRRGFVAAATDDGHQGGVSDEGRGERSAGFAIGHPERLIDFGYRALVETRATALAAIRAFYGRDATWSYFVGCSDGGREGLMLAQRFPEAFNGILVGDPGNNWSRWAAGLVWNELAQLDGTIGAIPVGKRALIQNAVVAACDAIDGIKDGLISDPRFCRFDPAVLTCGIAKSPDCLTAAQVATLRKIYDGPRSARTGERIFPGFPPGIEDAPGSNLITPTRPGTFSFGDSYFGQVVFERSDWDFRSFDFDRDMARSDRKVSPIIDSVDPDLRSFRDHGGKLIQYHGWSDSLMPAAGSIAYYEAVQAFMSRYPHPGNDSATSVDEFYRLFLIPGMGHCYGGLGPTAIAPTDATTAADPKYDLLLAIEAWVEKGVAPNVIIGTGKVPNDVSRTMSRPICPYPQMTRYKESGNPTDAASFVCAAAPSTSDEYRSSFSSKSATPGPPT